MSEIGGYFGLELSKNKEFHSNALRLNTGRNSFELILISKKFKKIYIPYYLCEAILEPLRKHKINFEFYRIDIHLKPDFDFNKIKANEGFLYVNYFGIMDRYISKLYRICLNLIIDNTQSFYSRPLLNVPTFYSCRKFFGVPDGAYLYLSDIHEDIFKFDSSLSRFPHLLKRLELGASFGYEDFMKNSNELSNQPILKMSIITKAILDGIDYEDIAKVRISNFLFLHRLLHKKNRLKITFNSDSVPMVYPFLSGDIKLREKLIENNVFVATYWQNVKDWCDYSSLEFSFVDCLLPLPIDQRYNIDDMSRIVEIIK